MRPSFIEWATSASGMYLHDKRTPTLATWQPYQIDILNHVFPRGDGRLPYSRILWSEVKKSGKSELAAAVHLYFALFVDVPGEQYVIANDLAGAQSRIFQSVLGSLRANPKFRYDTDWYVTGNKIVLSNGSTIKAIPSDYRGEAGSNHSLATVDEPWGIIYEDAEKLMTEFSPVPTRPNSSVFYTGYQGFEGQSNFWHNLIDSVRDGEPAPGLEHIDNGDGRPACWRAGRSFLFWSHVARQPWHTQEYMDEQRRSFTGRYSEYLRVWENRRVRGVDAFVTEEQWKKLYDPELRALAPDDRRDVVLGIDAATKNDCAAIVGVTWNAERKRVEVVYSRVWKPSDGEPLRLTDTIGTELVRLHQNYRVIAAYYDPYQMAAISEMCRDAGVKMVEFPQTARRLQSDKQLFDLAWGGNLAHYGDETLGEHVINAVTKTTDRGVRIEKQMSKLKVDAAVALSMAAMAAIETLTSHGAGMSGTQNPFYGGR